MKKIELENVYKELKSVSKTAKYFNCSYCKIKYWLDQYEIPYGLESHIKEININELEKIYLETQSIRKVGKYFEMSHEKARCLLNKYNLINKPIRYNHNENFFSKDTKESFYWAGFIAADGCILDQRASKILSISLSKDDKNHLFKFKKAISAENPIHDYLIRDSKRGDNRKDTWKSEIKITSDKLCSDLERFKIIPRKSLILEFPEWIINHSLAHHFLRGYVDGDGSFYINEVTFPRTVDQLYFTAVGTFGFLEKMKFIIENNCKSIISEKTIRPKPGCFVLEYGGNNVSAEIAKYLYQDSDESIRLDRKHKLTLPYIIKYDNEQAKKEEDKINEFRKLAFKKLWRPKLNDQEVINLYNNGETIIEISKKFKVRQDTISKILKNNNIILSNKQTESELTYELLKEMYDKFSNISKIAEELNHSPDTIKKYMTIHGINWLKHSGYDQNHTFFSKEKESKEQFYWAGFLSGASSIVSNNIRITLKDLSKIEKFNNSNISESPINQNGKYYSVSFSSDQIVSDLKKFNVDENKNTSFSIPDWVIKNLYLPYFLAGRFNVKGCFSEKYTEVTGTILFLEQIKKIFANDIKVLKNPNIVTRKNSNRIVYGARDSQKIYNWIKIYDI